MTGSGSLFASVIEDHLALKRRNGHLDDQMPIDEFVVDDPFENHPLFKTEDDARREEEETGEHPAVTLDLAADTLSMPGRRARRRRRAARVDRDHHRPGVPLGVVDGRDSLLSSAVGGCNGRTRSF